MDNVAHTNSGSSCYLAHQELRIPPGITVRFRRCEPPKPPLTTSLPVNFSPVPMHWNLCCMHWDSTAGRPPLRRGTRPDWGNHATSLDARRMELLYAVGFSVLICVKIQERSYYGKTLDLGAVLNDLDVAKYANIPGLPADFLAT